MPEKQPKIYRHRHPVRTVITVVLTVIIVLFILVSCIFFGFKKYIVYTDDGVRLDIPWLQDSNVENAAAIAFTLDN